MSALNAGERASDFESCKKVALIKSIRLEECSGEELIVGKRERTGTTSLGGIEESSTSGDIYDPSRTGECGYGTRFRRTVIEIKIRLTRRRDCPQHRLAKSWEYMDSNNDTSD